MLLHVGPRPNLLYGKGNIIKAPNELSIKFIQETQQKIIHTNQGKNDLLESFGNQQYFGVDEFIITEAVDYKLALNPEADPQRKFAAEIILDSLKNNFGNDYISIAIRGDNRCSSRSLMAGTLIAARRLIYQNRQEEADQLLNKLGDLADELHARRHEDQFKKLVRDFTKENYEKFKCLLNNIKTGKTTITELVLQANSDFSSQFVEPNSFNLALSSLAAFIIDKKLEEHAQQIGLDKCFLSDELNPYAVLSPGDNGLTSADRAAFLSTLNIQLAVPILRIDSVVKSINERNIKSLEDAKRNPALFNLLTTENDDGAIKIATLNSGGHTNLLLTGDDKAFMLQELNNYRKENLQEEEPKLKVPQDRSHRLTSINAFTMVQKHYASATHSNEKGRYHFFTATSNKFPGIKGDYLKTKILEQFKEQLERCTTIKELETEIKKCKKTAEFKILATSQGITSWLLRRETSSVKAFNEIEKELKRGLKNHQRYQI